MRKRFINTLMAFVIVLGSSSAISAELTFAFPFVFTSVVCIGLPTCGTPAEDTATLFLTVDLNDLRVSQVNIGEADVTNVGFTAPFPTTNAPPTLCAHPGPGPEGFTLLGTYMYDPLRGVGTLDLLDYPFIYSNTVGANASTQVGCVAPQCLWTYVEIASSPPPQPNHQAYQAVPSAPAPAFALAGPPVPLPAAILFLGSGLAALTFRRRRRATSIVSGCGSVVGAPQ